MDKSISKKETSESKVKALLAKQLRKKEEEIKLEHEIMGEFLKADSLDVVEMLMTLEEDYGVTIPDEDAGNLKTVGDLVNYLDKNQS